MIELKSNLDHLESLASSYFQDDAVQTASDFRGAVMDIRNLRDYAAQLEKNVQTMSAEINGLKIHNADASQALLAIIAPAIDRRIKEAMDDMTTEDIPGLEQMVDDRIEAAACDNDRDDETRDTVRDMIRDGDVVVSIDVS